MIGTIIEGNGRQYLCVWLAEYDTAFLFYQVIFNDAVIRIDI